MNNIMKLIDFVNPKINKRNLQVSLDLRKKKMKMHGIEIDDLMEMDITKLKREEFSEGDF